MANTSTSIDPMKPGRDYLTGQPVHIHPVILEAREKENAAFRVWLANPCPETCQPWNKLAERVDYLATLTDAQIDSEYDDLTPSNARPFDAEQYDWNELHHPEAM